MNYFENVKVWGGGGGVLTQGVPKNLPTFQ